MSLSPRSALCLLTSAVLFAAGCSIAPTPTEPIAKTITAQGRVRGGQQPVSGSTIQLYAVGATGDKSAATALLTQTVTTDAGGNFNISGLYTCPSASALVYLTATGGNPGLGSGKNNPNLLLMAAIGRCDSLTPATFLLVDEVTTVAAVSALAPFMTSATNIGSLSSDLASLQADFTMASYFANITTGTSPGLNVPEGATVPVATINTLADVLAACVNSTGGKAGDTSLCGQLFSLTTLVQTTTVPFYPTDTVGAMLDLALDPSLHTAALYNLATATPPYQPTLSEAPADFTVRLLVPAVLQASPASGLTFDSVVLEPSTSQQVTITNMGGSNLSLIGVTLVGADFNYFEETNNCSASLSPGGQCMINVTFQPTTTDVRNAYLQVASSDPASPLNIPLTGMYTPSGELTITPSQLTFPDTSVGFPTPSQTITLKNNTNSPISLTQTTSGADASDFVSISDLTGTPPTCMGTLDVGQSCTLTVTATPGALGARSASYIFASSGTSATQTVPLSVTGITTSNGPAELSNSRLSWTIANTTQDLLLENYGTTPLPVGAISLTQQIPNSFGVTNDCGTSVLPQSSCTISVTAYGFVSQSGNPYPYTGTLNVKVDTSAGTLTVPLSANDTSSVANPFAFPPVALNQVSNADFVVTPLSILNPINFNGTVSGPNAGNFAPASVGCSYDMMPVQPCSFPMTFTPTVTGITTAHLNTSSGYTVLSGSSGPAFTTYPATLVISPSVANGPASGSALLEITNTGSTTLSFTSFPITGTEASQFAASDPSGACASLTPATSCYLTVTYTNGIRASIPATLTLTESISGLSKAIPLSGLGINEKFKVSATRLEYPGTDIGSTSSPMGFTVTGTDGNPYGHDLTAYIADDTQNNSEGFHITSGSSCPASTTQVCTVSVIFSPGESAALSNNTESGYVTVVDTVSGQSVLVGLYGIAIGVPAVSLSPSSLTFAERPVGTTSLPTQMQLTNSGSAALTINSITIAGADTADFSQTNNCPGSLAVNASCTISVLYSPTATGTRTATVQIVSNAPTSPDNPTLTGTAD